MGWWQRHHGKSTRGRVVALLRRGERSVDELAQELGLTDNAIRAQLAQLERDGVVHPIGPRRDGTVGKPATLYGLGRNTSALFSSAYAPLLSSVLAELGERMPPRQVESLLRSAGRRLAPRRADTATFGERVRVGAVLLGELGADADLVRTDAGFEIRGHGCVLADAVAQCPATCRAVEALLSEVTGEHVTERCDRTGEPQCHFLIPNPRLKRST